METVGREDYSLPLHLLLDSTSHHVRQFVRFCLHRLRVVGAAFVVVFETDAADLAVGAVLLACSLRYAACKSVTYWMSWSVDASASPAGVRARREGTGREAAVGAELRATLAGRASACAPEPSSTWSLSASRLDIVSLCVEGRVDLCVGMWGGNERAGNGA